MGQENEMMLDTYNQKLKKLITGHEGKRAAPYKCPAGAMTIGVGWNMDANPLPKRQRDHLKQYGFITESMIDELLNISIERAEGDCMRLFPEFEKFDETRRMALTDFVFQLGFTRASRFVHAIAAINTGRWEDAAAHMLDSAWAKQTRRRALKITEMIEIGDS